MDFYVSLYLGLFLYIRALRNPEIPGEDKKHKF